jgi:small-conductance mechanosensitive channel
MSLINVVLWVGGVVLIALGYQRFRIPWSRYQALKEEDANAERYAAWRGGVRGASDVTGASVAMQVLRRQAQIGAAIAIAGAVLVFLGFLIK